MADFTVPLLLTRKRYHDPAPIQEIEERKISAKDLRRAMHLALHQAKKEKDVLNVKVVYARNGIKIVLRESALS